MPKITIESDEPCLVLVLPLPQRVEPKRAPRRVIETTAEVVAESLRPLSTVPSNDVVPSPPGGKTMRWLRLLAAATLLAACGGAAEHVDTCPRRTESRERDHQICSYLDWLSTHPWQDGVAGAADADSGRVLP